MEPTTTEVAEIQRAPEDQKIDELVKRALEVQSKAHALCIKAGEKEGIKPEQTRDFIDRYLKNMSNLAGDKGKEWNNLRKHLAHNVVQLTHDAVIYLLAGYDFHRSKTGDYGPRTSVVSRFLLDYPRPIIEQCYKNPNVEIETALNDAGKVLEIFSNEANIELDKPGNTVELAIGQAYNNSFDTIRREINNKKAVSATDTVPATPQ